ncbi:MAG: hypothetical protein ACJ72H_19540 [Candidatus Sulfotelmatobacter sp.]
MRVRNLPTIDAGYWTAIVAASICGTNTGDLAAGPLGMGHVRGLLPLSVIFLVIVWAEKMVNVTTVAFYWLAIIVLRTMATNIADFATHDLKLSYPLFVLLLIAFMGVMIWADRYRSDTSAQGTALNPRLPATDWSYWVLMLAAGVLGTAVGDWLADAGPGVYWASLIGMPFFVIAVCAAYHFGVSKPWYWIAIATCRTWGTDLGDMLVVLFRSELSRSAALWVSTAVSATLLTVVIYFWTHRNVAPELAAQSEAGH